MKEGKECAMLANKSTRDGDQLQMGMFNHKILIHPRRFKGHDEISVKRNKIERIGRDAMQGDTQGWAGVEHETSKNYRLDWLAHQSRE